MNIEELKIKYKNLKEQLGKKPSSKEFYKNTGSQFQLTKFFGNGAYSKFVEECGDTATQCGYIPNQFSNKKIEIAQILTQYGELTRKLNKIPTVVDWTNEKLRPTVSNIRRSNKINWSEINYKFLEFASGKNEWNDVVALIPNCSENTKNIKTNKIEQISKKTDKNFSPILESKINNIPEINISINSLKQEISNLSLKINITKEQISTEEATKMAFILPFLKLLEYDVFNHTEVQPELTADIGIKKGEKVDYGIFNNNKLIMIIECKHWEENLNIHKSQLHRYFHVTSTKIAVLTNGVNYKFYTDIEEPNKMDFEHFFQFNILNITDEELERLSLLKKSCFNLEQILNNAQFYKNAKENEYKVKIIKILMQELQEPSPSFVKYFVTQFCKKENINERSIEYFSKIVKNALDEFKKG